jgi:hypothetical protein
MATARRHFSITPNDSGSIYADALFVGGAGDVACVDRDGNNATYTVPAGGYVLTEITKVKSTGTTATGIIGLKF